MFTDQPELTPPPHDFESVEGDLERQLAGQMAGKYMLERLLGRGGVGSVWLARHVEVGSKVAIKVLDGRGDKTRQRLLREARAVNRVDSPHILPISDIGQLGDGRHFAMMEVLSGETLGERLASGCLPWAEMQPIALQIACALVTAHQAGVIHRDLKPENIFLAQGDCQAPRVKLLDFGIAEFVDDCVQGTGQSRLCPVHGTPLYVAPEQAFGEPCSPSADIYAFGVVLYEALAGRPPFVSNNIVQLLVAKNRELPPSLKGWRLPGVPQQVAELIDKMLAIDPERRPLTTTVWKTILDEGTRLEAVRHRKLMRSQSARWQCGPTLDIDELPDLTPHVTTFQPSADSSTMPPSLSVPVPGPSVGVVSSPLEASSPGPSVGVVGSPSNTAEIRPSRKQWPPATDEAEGVRPSRSHHRPLLKLAIALLGGLLFGATVLGTILATHRYQRVVSLPPEQAADRAPVARQLPEYEPTGETPKHRATVTGQQAVPARE